MSPRVHAASASSTSSDAVPLVVLAPTMLRGDWMSCPCGLWMSCR